MQTPNFGLKDKKKILVVTQYFWPENFRINEIVRFLKKKKYNVTVLTGQPNYPEGVLNLEYQKDPNNFNNFYVLKLLEYQLY